jgi:hypothetical protein
VELSLNGAAVPQSRDFRVGYCKDFIANDLIVYLNLKAENPVDIELKPHPK